MTTRKLYLNDGKYVRVWQVEYGSNITVSYGILGKKLIEKFINKQKSKTIAQTVDKLISDKLNEGYKETAIEAVNNVDLTDKHGALKPMKAQPSLKKITYPAICQPKYNGLRAMVSFETTTTNNGLFSETKQRVVIRSHEGLEYYLPRISHYFETANHIFLHNGRYNIILDGELYIHSKPLNYIRASVPFIKDGVVTNCKNDPNQVTFVIFDIVNTNMNQLDRITLLYRLANNISTLINNLQNNPILFLSPYVFVHNEEDAYNTASKYHSAGFEGGIVRNINASYQPGKRSWDLGKIKFSKVGYFEVIDVIAKENEPNTGLFVLVTKERNVFKSNPVGTYAQRHEYLINKKKYIGQNAYVRYFEIGPNGVPVHSNVLEVIT